MIFYFVTEASRTMFRLLVPLRCKSQNVPRELNLLQKIRYPLYFSFSSGILYHSFKSPDKHTCPTLFENKHEQKKITHPTLEDMILLFSDQDNKSFNKLPNEAKMDRLLRINQDIEDELPLFFEKTLFNELPKNLLDSDTVVYYERRNGSVCRLKGESWIRALVVASRAYFSLRSYGRRLELTSILSDTERWEVEVCFRIVLLPSPSTKESHLPSDKLLERLEQRAQWRNFRATFYLSDSGKINAIKLTQLLPPFKDSTALHPLNQLTIRKILAPSLSGRRRLPTPTSHGFGQLSLQRNDDISNDGNHNDGVIFWTLFNAKHWLLAVGKIIKPFDVVITSLPDDQAHSGVVGKKQTACICLSNDHPTMCDHTTNYIPSVHTPCQSFSLNSILLEFYMKHSPSIRNNSQNTTEKQRSLKIYSTSYGSYICPTFYSLDNSTKSDHIATVEQFKLSKCFASFPSSSDMSSVFYLCKLYI
ncbi:hypothetical protein Smp_181130 [Schistosoma mansoni]|uniref:hypothetical protein n=1 Tax=Schistosoma mansoni TaxID=6183 RepID=UPI0001A62DA9|nr:hypothetical protein Smp_181130 [Schistosoma mansoni]|eukprot:XP_018650078.1 hypothetical protein Smp_181130 [Schistosoma mansoni]